MYKMQTTCEVIYFQPTVITTRLILLVLCVSSVTLPKWIELLFGVPVTIDRVK